MKDFYFVSSLHKLSAFDLTLAVALTSIAGFLHSCTSTFATSGRLSMFEALHVLGTVELSAREKTSSNNNL